MPTEFPLWRLRPEEAARIIILAPLQAVERHKHWHKREMRIRASRPSKPRVDDLKTLDKAKYVGFWEEYLKQWTEAFPIAALKAKAIAERIPCPLPVEREREPWQGMYSRAQFETDMRYFEQARALVRENFILGQQGEGPYMDGLLYLKLDSLMLAEMDHCKARLGATSAIMEARRHAKGIRKANPEKDEWHPIGRDEAIAFKFKQSGYPIRKIGLHSYEVLMNPRKARTK